VVAAVGNSGGQMSDPATDQFILNVGSAAAQGTTSAGDDTISTFTSLTYAGGANRRTDVLAPGEAIVSLRDPASNIDAAYPAARVGATLFRGSGTSQATAVTSAAVALLLQARPGLTPDQAKDLIIHTGTILTAGNAFGAGYSEVNVNRAVGAATPTAATQNAAWSSGTGRLEAARGGTHVSDNGTLLSGEKSIFGPFDSAAWAAKAATRTTWSGGLWMGYRYAGDGWTGTSWASKTWASATWSGRPWGTSTSWVDPNWTGRYWSGSGWAGGGWVGRYWSSDDWAAAYWG
jgi:serine protease AprX